MTECKDAMMKTNDTECITECLASYLIDESTCMSTSPVHDEVLENKQTPNLDSDDKLDQLNGSMVDESNKDDSCISLLELSLPASFDESFVFDSNNQYDHKMIDANMNTELLLFCNSAKIEMSKLRKEKVNMRQEIDTLKRSLQDKHLNISKLSLSEEEYSHLKRIPEHALDLSSFLSMILFERTLCFTKEINELKIKCNDLSRALNQNADAAHQEHLRSSKVHTESQLEQARAKLLQLQADVLTFQGEQRCFDGASRKLDEVTMELETMRETLHKKDCLLDQSEQNRISSNEKMIHTVQEIEALRNQNESLQKELKTLKDKNGAVTREMQLCQQNLRDKTLDNDSLSLKLQEIQVKTELQLNKNYENSMKKLRLLHQNQINDLHQHFEDRHETELGKLKIERDTAEQELFKVRLDLEQMHDESKSSTERYMSLLNEKDKQVSDIRNEQSASKVECAKIITANEVFASDLRKASTQIDYLRDQIRVYEKELANLSSNAKSERETLKEQLKKKSDTLDAYLDTGLDMYCGPHSFTGEQKENSVACSREAIFLEIVQKCARMKEDNNRLVVSLKTETEHNSVLQQKLTSTESELQKLIISFQMKNELFRSQEEEITKTKREKNMVIADLAFVSKERNNVRFHGTRGTSSSGHSDEAVLSLPNTMLDYNRRQGNNSCLDVHRTFFGGKRLDPVFQL